MKKQQNTFIKKEIIFNNQNELANYLIQAFSKVKRLNYNLKSITKL